jgi:ribosomal subunit interface protein
MKVKFYFNGTEIKGAEKEYIRKKIEKFDKYFKNQTALSEIEIEKDKIGNYRVEFQLKGPGFHFIGEEKAETVQAAFDLVCDKMIQQIREAKEKRQTLNKRKAISLKKEISIDEGARF